MVYFLQPAAGGPVKIGYSADVDRRREELETAFKCPLVLLATMEGGRVEEGEIHRRFAPLRIGRTEQFRPALELMEFIGRPLFAGPNPDAVEAIPGRLSDTKPVRLDLTAEVHQMLRVVAAERGKPMAVFAREVVEQTVRELYEQRKGGG